MTTNLKTNSKVKKTSKRKNTSKTRLISIVSTPIKVVVVVVVIVVDVFIKKIRSKNFFDPKAIHAHKTLGIKVLYPKNLGKKKIRYQKVLVQKIKVEKNLGSKIF